MKKRLYQLDNMKFFLIFLVVFGHLLEAVPGQVSHDLYQTIYLFHMPAFIFLSGCCASFRPAKIRTGLILPYLIFQTLYTLFLNCVIRRTASFTLSFTTPYWILWYIFAVAVYEILIPFFDVEKRKHKILIVAGSVVVSLLAGYDNSVGYYFSVSRILTFAPYFLCGYYCKADFFQCPAAKREYKNALCIVLSAAVFVTGILYCRWLDPAVLYGSYSYDAAGYTPMLKLFLLLIGFSGIFLLRLIPEKRIPMVSDIGANTKSVYLLHGFVILWVKNMSMFTHRESVNLGNL